MKNTTDIYFDFEFMDDGKTIVPISLGMCTNDVALSATAPDVVSGLMSVGDRVQCEFYQEYEFDPARANDWVRANVFPHLDSHRKEQVGTGATRPQVASWIKEWVADVCGDTKPRFWGYYPSYDWVLLCQHFGTMVQGPTGWPIRPECLQQLADSIGIPRSEFPDQPGDTHNALADAKWNRELCAFLHKRWEADAP